MEPVAVIGAGPAGLAAAEVVAEAGLPVVVYEQMPSPGRKLLMAGLGGLNITHSEPREPFIARYAERAPELTPIIEDFTPDDLRDWCARLGEGTFVGSSGRVFPDSFKASPLLRAWLTRLEQLGVRLHNRHRWTGWDDSGALRFEAGGGQEVSQRVTATVLGLGGATWPRLGSTGAWKRALAERGVPLSPFAPSNCGFEVDWTPHLLQQAEGKPVKNVGFHFGKHSTRGEAVITRRGIEGGAVYALSAAIRDALAQEAGPQTLRLDLLPQWTGAEIEARLSRAAAKARRKDSLGNRLRKALNLDPVQRALFFEGQASGTGEMQHQDLAAALKSVPLSVLRPFGMERAISSDGGVAWEAVDSDLQIRALPTVYAAGEMLDWEAPTGGYLLQACIATGRWAGKAVVRQIQG